MKNSHNKHDINMVDVMLFFLSKMEVQYGAGTPTPLTLKSVKSYPDGAVWLRYLTK